LKKNGYVSRIAFLLLLAAVLTIALVGCSSRQADTTIVVSGSTTILPIAEQAAEEFRVEHPRDRVLVSGMGSSAGIEAVGVSETADIGTTSRELKDDEENLGLLKIPIAHDGIAVIVHPSNPIDGLTVEEIRSIFSGQVKNWAELGGADLPITLINRDESSGTRDAFGKAIMGDEAFEINAVVLPGTGQVREVVTRTPGAVGYISVGFVAPRFSKTEVKALKVSGIEPTDENVSSKLYPIARTLYFLTKGMPEGVAKEYIDYVLSPAVQQGAVIDAGFLPIQADDATDYHPDAPDRKF